MQVGLIGLGKMGLNLGKNLMDHDELVPKSVTITKNSLGNGTTRCC